MFPLTDLSIYPGLLSDNIAFSELSIAVLSDLMNENNISTISKYGRHNLAGRFSHSIFYLNKLLSYFFDYVSCKVSSENVPAMRSSYSFPAAVSLFGADCVCLVLSVGLCQDAHQVDQMGWIDDL